MIDEDQKLKRLLLNKEGPEPSSNLDEKIMADINEVLNKNSANHNYLLWAWIFLAVATIVGIAISVTWISPNKNILRLPYTNNGVIIQILCALIILLLFDRLYILTDEIRKKTLT
jgi:hypothetical protein